MTISIKNKKKIVAVVTALTVWGSAIAPVFAITAAELQTQIDTLMAQLASLQTQLSLLEGGTTPVTGCTITSFTHNLKQGMSGDDVKCLQVVLNSDAATKLTDSGVGSPGNETSYFGPLTKAAVIKFQEKYMEEILTIPYGLTAGTGFVGTTTRTKLNSMLGTGGVVTPPVDGEVGTAATVSLAVDTPAAAQVALNAQDVVLTKIKFTAGADAYTISKIVIARGGVSADTDVSSISLYDGTTRLGSVQALNTTTHKATFSSLSWEITSYSVKYLTIKASIAGTALARVGDSIRLGIAVSSDITSTVTPSGTYPIMGNAKTLAGISVGELWVARTATPATNTSMLSGAVDQEIACWSFSASTTEGFNVHSIKVSHVGNANNTDVSNLKLKVAAAQIGSTVASLDASNQATFDLSSSPLTINGGAIKTVCAYTDIASGIWTARTIKFEITQYTDVVAYGSNSGGAVTIGYSDTVAFYRQTGNRMTVGQGALTVALDAALNPSAQSYVKGTSNRDIIAVKFSTGATEGARVTKIRFTLSGAATNISSITLWDGTTQIAGPASAIGTYINFGSNTIGWDTTGLFDLESSSNKTLLVKADIPAGAASGAEVSLRIAANADVWADGLNSRYDLAYGSGGIVASASGNTHTISGVGTLAVSLTAGTPPAQTYVKGSLAKVFTKADFMAGSGEDVVVSSIVVRCYRGADVGTPCTSGDLTNAKILKSDGTMFGSTVALVGATASFSGSLTVVAANSKTLSFVADIPTGSEASSVHLEINATSSATDLYSVGVSSGADITETGGATGKLMTLGQGSLTISAAPTPADQSLIIGAAEVPFVGLVMTAGIGEDVKVTRIVLTTNSTEAGTTTDVSNIALYDGTTRLTVKKPLTQVAGINHTVTFSASDFLNYSGVTLTKGQQKTITVKANIPTTASSSATIAFGIAPSWVGGTTTTDVTMVGLSSNTTPDPILTLDSGGNLTGVNYLAAGHANAYEVTLASRGALVVVTTADTPVEAIQSVSIQGIVIPNIAFHKSEWGAVLEQVDVKSISIERQTGGRDSDFSSVSLYEGDTLLAGPQSIANSSTTFSFAADNYWRIPTAGARYLTIKANLNGIRLSSGFGSETGDAPQLGLDTITAEGVSSGLTPSTLVANSGVVDLLGNAQILRQSQPTVALSSPTSETYGAGTKELIRWTVTADTAGNVGWAKIVFDVSGGITVGTVGYTVGTYPDNCDDTAADGIYMSTSTTCLAALATQLIAASSMQVWDVDTNTQVTASSTPTVDQATVTSTARVTFIAASEQQVGANTTKTYKLMGNILSAGVAGSALMTKIESRSVTNISAVYDTVAASSTITFVWTDRSGASGTATHSMSTADWASDYKITGIPTAAKSLSK